MPPELDARHLLRRVIQVALVALVIVAAVSALPDLGDVRERFAGARPAWLAAALALETGSILAFDVATLWAAFQAFGSAPPPRTFALAYTLGQLGGLIPLPDGIGGTDGGLIGALVIYGTPLSGATAAVLAYRAFQLGLPTLLGTVAFTQMQRTLARSRAPGGDLRSHGRGL